MVVIERVEHFTVREATVLREFVQARHSEWSSAFDEMLAGEPTQRRLLLELCASIGVEVANVGIDSNGRTLPRGAELERLVDLLSQRLIASEGSSIFSPV